MSIIPMPNSLTIGDGYFRINQDTRIILPSQDGNWTAGADFLNKLIENATGNSLRVDAGNGPQSNSISITFDPSLDGPHCYILDVDEELISIRANTDQAAFYAIQSLIQLAPNAIFAQSGKARLEWDIPVVSILDKPRFSYRGMHLDVSRHFFGVEDVKRFIDLLAIHKINHFHWHLTDDQGWRIEIKSYPKLTEVGGYRNETLIGHNSDVPQQYDGERYGGFYSQEEIKEVVRYASQNFITIIPELELTGHAQAALAAYPEFACSEGPFEVLTKWGVSEEVFCPKESTFEFLEAVINETADLFPGPHMHIGGDECPKTRWNASDYCQDLIRREGLADEYELQSYFNTRIETLVNAKGKGMIGWDEILEGGLAPNATVMSWRGEASGIQAASMGHNVIMSPTSHCYFDYYQSRHEDEPLAIGGYLPLEKVYSYDPVPEALPNEFHHHVLGAQGNIWTEYITNRDKLDYMAFPRVCAIAEVGWTEKSNKDYSSFTGRMDHHIERLHMMGVKAAEHQYDIAASFSLEAGQVVAETIRSFTNQQYLLHA